MFVWKIPAHFGRTFHRSKMEKMMIDDAIKKGQDAIWKLSIALENHAHGHHDSKYLKSKKQLSMIQIIINHHLQGEYLKLGFGWSVMGSLKWLAFPRQQCFDTRQSWLPAAPILCLLVKWWDDNHGKQKGDFPAFLEFLILTYITVCCIMSTSFLSNTWECPLPWFL